MIQRRFITPAALLSLLMLPLPGTASVVGFLGNFDVVNDTGRAANGFEIDLEGLHASDITDVFGGPGRGFPTGRGFGSNSVERYGSPSITEYANGGIFGTKVTYFALFSSATGSWDYSTPSTTPGSFVTPGDNCWSGGGLGYSASTPCDHFGVGTRANASKTTYSWLYGDTSGTLSNAGGAVSLPAPVWTVMQAPAAAPVVVAQVQAPQPVQPVENPEPQWGDAIWVKVFTTELDQAVGLEELVADNAKVKEARTETEWQLLQKDPGDPASGQLESGYGAPVGPNAEAILRRYEFYKFGGAYDPVDHHALLAGTDSLPGPGDVGAYIGAQNAGVNLALAAAPVPEPGSHTLVLAGLGLLGFAARRARR